MNDSEITDGGPVHPNQLHAGMTLRDYFAAKALPAVMKAWEESRWNDLDAMAAVAYEMADAMLKARKQ